MTKKEINYKLGQMNQIIDLAVQFIEKYYSLKKEVEPLTDKDIENYLKYEDFIGSTGLELVKLEVRLSEEE